MRSNPGPPLAFRWRPLASFAVVSALAACSPDPRLYDVPAKLTRALESPGVAPRLSVATTFRACPQADPGAGTIPRTTCPAPEARERKALARLAAHAGRMRDEGAALHTLALVDLLADDPHHKALDRSIASLRGAAETADRPASVLADLAAALIVRAERTQAPRDLLEAFEVAEQAVRMEPANLAARYNRALSLDRFGLVDEAASDWQAYLDADSTSGWADEARRRLRAARALAVPPSPPPFGAPAAAFASYAAADPQGAREMGMNRLLARWGDAVFAGDGARAEQWLRHAETLGEALERRPGGDASLADAVRAIRAAANAPAATNDLARAHRAYAAGQIVFDSLKFERAEAHFAAAAGASGPSPVLRGWATVYRAAAWLQLVRLAEGERVLERAVREASPRHPALAGRARWPLGSSLARTERWEPALEQARAAEALFARTGERVNEAAALGIAAEVHFTLGEPDSGYAALHRAADRLKRHRGSVSLHNLLVAAATQAASDGFVRSAIRLQGEGVRVATRSRKPEPAAEARLERARYLAAAGELARAAADLDTARAVVGTLTNTRARDWFEAHLREADAVVSLRTAPLRAALTLDSAAAHFGQVQRPLRVLPLLVGSAEARLAAGDQAGAVQRLEAAVRLLDRRRDSIRIEPRRAAVFDAARGVVDRIVMLKLADGRVREALHYMDRGRASLAAAGPAARGRSALPPPGETVVEYARVADTLLIWTVSETRVDVARTVIDTLRLARTLQELEAGLERGAPEGELRPALSLLHAWLVRPVAGALGGAERPLVIVADGEIAAVPFGALYDAERRRYLVEDHPLRFAVSLHEARRPAPANPARGVLLVADPAFDRARHPVLERLAHAGREVAAIRPAYPGATVLQGAGATRAAVESALAGAGVAHFAGHAVFDDQRPERSYLVLAPSPGAGGEGKLTAAELARLDLRHVRVVVLSACRTVRAGRGRAGGFSGLSGALLAAGAGGAVGSTWQVDDRLTSALMTRFHRAYGSRPDGPRALRDAQLALLRSGDRALRSPSAWAGFRYAGR